MQSCKPHINVRNSKENKPSSKILASTQNQSQEMIDKFMRKRLLSNQTASRPIILAEHVDNDGVCTGSAYSDPYGNWGNVIVLGSLKITLQDYIADVRINTNHNDATSPERRGGRMTRIGSQETTAADRPAGGARHLTPGCTQVISFLHCYALLVIARRKADRELVRHDGEGHSTPQGRREPRIGTSRPRGGLKKTPVISRISRARTCDGHNAVFAISGATEPRANQARIGKCMLEYLEE
ncbi:hypothetical protein G5I_09574 [Acromyrmex echinatior]|uniref:Uncharacterized protein n=1 Tax=Acromyrmex echinatior TaxID=103372 RepID=F4WUK2_ACREC|nr:hypothetical protein G5I_09574 [Acromyrmex echinatior]